METSAFCDVHLDSVDLLVTSSGYSIVDMDIVCIANDEGSKGVTKSMIGKSDPTVTTSVLSDCTWFAWQLFKYLWIKGERRIMITCSDVTQLQSSN